MKDIVLVLSVVILVALTLLIHHFVSCALFLLESGIASGFGFMPGLARLALGAFGVWLPR